MQYQKTGLTVSDVARLFQGKGVDKKKCNEEKKGLPVIVGASSLKDGGVEVTRWIENPAPTAVISKFGDILVSAQGTCGKVGVNNVGDAVITDAIIAVRPIPWLMHPGFLLMIILYGIEEQHVIPEFDEDTVGFQRCIKAEVIGNIEIEPLDTLKEIETVASMKKITQSLCPSKAKEQSEDPEISQLDSLEDVLNYIKTKEKDYQKSCKDLEKCFDEIVKNNSHINTEILQEELF